MSLVRFFCAEHGYVCSAPATATVVCGRPMGRKKCNRKARPK